MFLHICVSASSRFPVFLFPIAATCKKANKKKRTPHLSFPVIVSRITDKTISHLQVRSREAWAVFEMLMFFAAEEPWKLVIPTCFLQASFKKTKHMQ